MQIVGEEGLVVHAKYVTLREIKAGEPIKVFYVNHQMRVRGDYVVSTRDDTIKASIARCMEGRRIGLKSEQIQFLNWAVCTPQVSLRWLESGVINLVDLADCFDLFIEFAERSGADRDSIPYARAMRDVCIKYFHDGRGHERAFMSNFVSPVLELFGRPVEGTPGRYVPQANLYGTLAGIASDAAKNRCDVVTQYKVVPSVVATSAGIIITHNMKKL
ncbi:MAG: hypothetical protein SP1CHLAM54_08220 [Chlamydiia bacterium]|nr:hypothetical protein [Chlamydiia bacterium]MCH9615728.1 hypothetical protein [Chlamydiia bacterium]MCH9628869.1 hypothetical protein [Chlamydiia bacterium]